MADEELTVKPSDQIEIEITLVGAVRHLRNGEDIGDTVHEDGLKANMLVLGDVAKVAIPASIAEFAQLNFEQDKEKESLGIFFRRLAFAARKMADPDFAEEPPEYPTD